MQSLRAEANGTEQRLFKLAERVGLPAHGLSKHFFDISDAISRQTGAMVDRRNLTISEPIKSLGSYSVTAHLIGEVDAAFLVNVIAQ